MNVFYSGKLFLTSLSLTIESCSLTERLFTGIKPESLLKFILILLRNMSSCKAEIKSYSSLAPSAQPRTVEQQMSVEWLCGRIGTKEDQRIPNEELRKWLKGVKLEKKFSRNAKPFLREAGTRIMIMTSILIKVSKIEHCPTIRVDLLSWALGCPVYHPRPAGRPAWKVDALF